MCQRVMKLVNLLNIYLFGIHGDITKCYCGGDSVGDVSHGLRTVSLRCDGEMFLKLSSFGKTANNHFILLNSIIIALATNSLLQQFILLLIPSSYCYINHFNINIFIIYYQYHLYLESQLNKRINIESVKC